MRYKHTSQCSRMAERPPTTDLSGGKASADSFTRLMANLVVEYAVDFQFDTFSSVALRLAVSSEGFNRPLRPVSVTDFMGSGAASSVLRAVVVRRIPLSVLVHIPLDSHSCESGTTDDGRIEDGIPRSGSE